VQLHVEHIPVFDAEPEQKKLLLYILLPLNFTFHIALDNPRSMQKHIMNCKSLGMRFVSVTMCFKPRNLDSINGSGFLCSYISCSQADRRSRTAICLHLTE